MPVTIVEAVEVLAPSWNAVPNGPPGDRKVTWHHVVIEDGVVRGVVFTDGSGNVNDFTQRGKTFEVVTECDPPAGS